ncbi:MAG: hemerythrin domain-containing protein [Candidatus Nanoarchaeia archaeon]|nr:hemerythrin domain-containing protein [Candidatus Nanoarchaeia archaeon]MDD5053829.1 hemerythrin domain-containing protein [Candidatus Nanoarchaeia archaeon]MDD5499507.1 hemerythrin domain-containing protein [Candidatus Nanoarchaeia archaeon]
MEANEMLLYEHKIIYSLLKKLQTKIEEMKKTKEVQGSFIDLLTDFFMTYIDVYHHGKEENIMFERLKKKNLTQKHKDSMDLLLKQHELGRKLTEKIIKTTAEYFKGRTTQIDELIKILEEFKKLYIEHAEFEDNHFFKEALEYFSSKEKEQLIQDFFKFNIRMVDEKYKNLIEII